jgi:hypothetical protein
VLTKEEHAALLRSFAVDRLLQLVTLEAKRLHDGHVTIVALTTHYQVAFGPPTLSPGSAGGAYASRAEMPGSPTLKEVLMSRTLKVRGEIISQVNRYLGGFCSSRRIFRLKLSRCCSDGLD